MEFPTRSVMVCSISSTALALLLGRAKGVVSPTEVECSRTGFMFRTAPAQAAARAMRPVRARKCSVSTMARKLTLDMVLRAASHTSLRSAPLSAARAASSTVKPQRARHGPAVDDLDGRPRHGFLCYLLRQHGCLVRLALQTGECDADYAFGFLAGSR